MINDTFNEWSANLAETASMDQLKGAVVGIEAAEYLNRLSKFAIPRIDRLIDEALLPALGGLPFGLRAVIQQTLTIWKERNITPVFVFSGLDVGKRDPTFITEERGAQINAQAWGFYDAAASVQAVDTFAKSGSVTAEHLYRFLQQILDHTGVAYQVAPYGAWAQLAYLQKVGSIDTIYGSSEVLLFDVPELITSWDFMNGDFVWVRKRACLEALNITSPEAFIDAYMLSGSSKTLLPPLPQLDNPPYNKQPKIKSAADMVMRLGAGNGHSVCLTYKEDPLFRSLDYLNRYRKARLAVKHHVVLLQNGTVEPFELRHIPNDIHECIGHQLPEELYFYLSKGIIGPRVLNWRTSNDIVEPPPLDGGDSKEYRTLVGEQLTETRTMTIGLLSQSLHRFNLHTEMNLRSWFDKEKVKVISMGNSENSRKLVDKWNVHGDVFGPYTSEFEGKNGVIGLCVKALKAPDFAVKTHSKKNSRQLLKTSDEILLNSMWRLLHLRGYIDDKHELTPWGLVLYEIIANLPSGENEEAALIAVELARFALLNADDMFPSYSGGPHKGSERDRRNTLLITRILCLGNFQHQEIGFTGPLSRDLLGFHSMISAIRSSLRDLAEVCMTTLLLNGDADRDRSDWNDLGLRLPFLLHNNCVLGLAAGAYFAQILPNLTPTVAQKEAALDATAPTFEWAVDYKGDVKKGFKLWDAVYKGVQATPATFKQKAIFEEANKWLTPLR